MKSKRRSKGYGISFLTEDSRSRHHVYFEKYVNGKEGYCDMAILRDCFIYAKMFRSMAAAERMRRKIIRRVKDGTCACPWPIDEGEVFFQENY